jgi:two-component system, OmpR family, sensor histidine kinase QseC
MRPAGRNSRRRDRLLALARAIGRDLVQPSLVRRIVIALLSSFVLVLLVFLVRNYVEVKRDFDKNLAIKVRAEAMAPVLARLTDERDAGLALASIAEMLNARRRQNGFSGSVVHQLRRADGALVAAWPSDARSTLPARSGHIVRADIGGQPHFVVQADAGPWRVLIAAPAAGDWTVLQWLGQDILGDLLLALPLVLLPAWLAVRSGVRPLRQLAAAVAARDPQDLSPLGVAPPHAELQPLVAAFEQLLARLRQKVRLERAFVQDAAHELRTPMAAIGTQAHVLARTADPAERQRAEAALALMLQRAAHLHQQLLELAVLDDGQASVPDRHDLAALVQAALALAEPRAAAKAIELSLDAPERCEQSIDLPAFQSVLHNLLDNALRYVPAGGRIEVRLAAQPGGWCLTVADDGPGLSAAQRERAFDRFWRGASDTTGSGLGLAIVRQAAHRLCAKVQVANGIDGRGIAFAVRTGA